MRALAIEIYKDWLEIHRYLDREALKTALCDLKLVQLNLNDQWEKVGNYL